MRRTLVLPIVLACAAGLWARPAAATLYDQLGGKPVVDRMVSDAVDIYIADPRLAGYFDDISAAWLKPRFANYICQLADGPCVYRGRAMGPEHKGLHIDERAFNVVVEDLQLAMRRCDIPFRVQNRLLARLAPMERQIVTR
jgi:hemoglobin